jgi:hypothetical protein
LETLNRSRPQAECMWLISTSMARPQIQKSVTGMCIWTG